MPKVHNIFSDLEPASGSGDLLADWDFEAIKPQLKPVEKLDTAILPDSIKDWSYDVAHRMQCPIDYVAVGLMVALASVVGRKFIIYPKQRDNWAVVPVLWGGVVGNPSAKKSPALSEALKPIGQLEKQAHDDYQTAITQHKIEDELQQYQEKANHAKIKKLISNGNTEEARKILESANATQAEKPTRKRHKVNDSTVEKLGELLQDNPNGLLVFLDELTVLLKSLDRQDNQTARGFFLSGWGGDQAFTFDRIARGTTHIDNVCLSILGGIQPARLRSYVKAAISGNDTADGLLQRFQLLVYPDMPKNWQYIDQAPSQNAMQRVSNLFNWVDSIEVDQPIKVKFTQDAQNIFIEWLTELEQKLVQDLHHAIESHLAKYRSLAPALALLIEIADQPNKLIESVSKKSLLKACEWCDYLESHAMRIYALSTHAENENALLISKRFNKLPNPFTRRDIHQKGWTGLSDIHDVEKAINLLLEHGYIREENPTQDTGRPTTCYAINPRILDHG